MEDNAVADALKGKRLSGIELGRALETHAGSEAACALSVP